MDNFENDILKLKEKMSNNEYATAFYAALCNIKWRNKKTNEEYHCTWRYSGGLVARIRDIGEDYTKFYCSGYEGRIRLDVLCDIVKLGWSPEPYKGNEIETYT